MPLSTEPRRDVDSTGAFERSFAAAMARLQALGAELAAGPAPGGVRRKFDLAHMRALTEALGDPQRQFRAVLIAGTNGKGSTAATLAHIAAAAGVRTGLYTSPHLVRPTERIRTNTASELRMDSAGASARFSEISGEAFARLFFKVDDAARALLAAGRLPHAPSYFETLTALAFLCFAEQQIELAVLEVGLGGRLDATNIVEPLLSIVTDIALDHQEYLGPTITEIAREKAGILRQNGVLVTLPQHPEANQALGEAAVAWNVRGVNAADYLPGRSFAAMRGNAAQGGAYDSGEPPWLPRNRYTVQVEGAPLHVDSRLFGEHQQRNIALAIAAAVELRNHNGYRIPNAAIEAGIRNTAWPGRLEFRPPNVLLDVAHNPAGAWTLRAALAHLPESQPRTLLFSCLRDKDLREMAQILFPLFDASAGRPQDHIVFAPIDSPRAASVEQLLACARALDVPAEAATNAAEALALARRLTPPGGLIVVTGSIYLIGALRDG
jgi:dihydrofolate synthase/folylpolyglutamate synthase